MKLAIVNLTAGGLSGGYLKYLRMLIPILETDPSVEFMVVYTHSQAFSYEPSTVKTRWYPLEMFQGSLRMLKEHVLSQDPDVVFVPTARWFDTGPVPLVTMVRNMEPLVEPCRNNTVKESLKNLMRARIAKTACRRSSGIIAVSSYVREFLSANWGIESGKINVVYHGIEEPSERYTVSAPEQIPALFREGFIFTAGSIRPARGLEDLIHAIGTLKARGIKKRLVIAGSSTPGTEGYKKKLNRLIKKESIEDMVCWTGSLNNTELSWCYSNSRLFVMTSRMEACPNVVLEAMIHGCLCISTLSPPMPEFFKDSALYYAPGNREMLAEKILETDHMEPSEWEKLKLLACQYAQTYSWQETARKTMDVLRSVARY